MVRFISKMYMNLDSHIEKCLDNTAEDGDFLQLFIV